MWVVLFLHLVCAAEAGHFTHQWSVHLDGGDPVAAQIADKHGFVNRGKVSYAIIFFVIISIAENYEMKLYRLENT